MIQAGSWDSSHKVAKCSSNRRWMKRPLLLPYQIIKKLGCRLDAGDEQVIAGAGAGDVE
jgi:hypothetical protein